jgi:succinate-semialdehyde dehydrogenase/glutarate-semialdehyde dehydrogenase
MSSTTQEQDVLDAIPGGLFIAGEWRDAGGGGQVEVEDPATGQTLREVADGSPNDATAALDAAVEAQADWAATPATTRSEILWHAFEQLTRHIDDLALLMTMERG